MRYQTSLGILVLATLVGAQAPTVLLQKSDGGSGSHFGSSTCFLGDLDDDGRSEVAFGAPRATGGGAFAGLVNVYRHDGSLLLSIAGVPYEALGISLAAAGDVNRDGRPDLLVGSWGAISTPGAVSVFSGADGSLLLRRSGFAGDAMGEFVAGLGDVNNDGYPDFACTDRHNSAGGVLVWSGSNGGLLHSILGVAPGEGVGVTVANVGDLDGDGFADLAIGSPLAAPAQAGSGAVLDFGESWLPRAILTRVGIVANDELGSHACGLGDTDGDGRAEIAVGAEGTGEIVVLRPDGSVRWSVQVGNPVYVTLSALAPAGDVDGDGVPDLVFGCLDHGAFSAGQVRVCSGVDGTVLRAASGNNGDQLGFAVAGVGDLDGDGFDDYAAGAPLGLPSVHGYVRVWSGRTGAILQTMAGDAPQEWFGAAIAGVGDIDGDGVPDLGVGAPLATRRAPNGGFVRVYSGRNFAPIAEKTGNTTDENLGTSVAALGGDWDGDGLFDYVAGSPRNNEGAGTDSGSVFVFNLGGHVLHRFDGSPGDRLGAVVAGAGDVDGDGRPEVAGSALSRYVRVFAGRGDHALLHEFTAPQPRFGTAIDLRADLDCDGMADLVLGAAGGGGGNGVLQGLDLDHPGTPARVLVRGRACPTSAGRLPHLDPRGRPALGNAFAVRLRAAGVGAIAALAVGLPMQLDLTALGAPGCTAAVNPFGLLAAVTSATGVATFPIAVPRDTALLGVRLDCQSLVFDAGANALGIVFSTQLVAWIGR